MAFRTSSVVILLLTVWVKISLAAFETEACDPLTQAQVEQYIGTEMGLSADEIHGRLIVSDLLSDRSFDKTWASSLSLEQYEDINFGGSIVKANKHRFSYPAGEASAGYRRVSIANSGEPHQTWETRAREVWKWSYNYMVQLSGLIDGFGELFPVRPTLDQNCEQRFHATHAELKLLTRMMRQNELPEGQNAVISVSRHMCNYCVPIVAHLSRNGGRKIAVIAPRKKTKGVGNFLEQPEYILFQADGSFKRYKRQTANAASLYQCQKSIFTGAIPAGLDTYHAPDPNFNVLDRMVVQEGGHTDTDKDNDTNNEGALVPRKGVDMGNAGIRNDLSDLLSQVLLSLCPDESEGPETECITFIGGDLPKSVHCPRPETMTGIHGTFGPLSAENPSIVLKSIGSFCEVSTKVAEMGPRSVIPFELKCPEDHQLTGFHGTFGLLVDQIGIICRRISDGSEWRSSTAGSSTGGSLQSKECQSGYAGREIKLWDGEGIDGLGLCCR